MAYGAHTNTHLKKKEQLKSTYILKRQSAIHQSIAILSCEIFRPINWNSPMAYGTHTDTPEKKRTIAIDVQTPRGDALAHAQSVAQSLTVTGNSRYNHVCGTMTSV